MWADVATACSGDICRGILPPPTDVPSPPKSSHSYPATPKSIILGKWPSWSRLFAGLMSRCIMPRPCAQCTAVAMLAGICSAVWTGNGPCSSSTSRTEGPATYSMVRYGHPSCPPVSRTLTLPAGWWTDAARASRRKRWRSNRLAIVPHKSTITATMRSDVGSKSGRESPRALRRDARELKISGQLGGEGSDDTYDYSASTRIRFTQVAGALSVLFFSSSAFLRPSV